MQKIIKVIASFFYLGYSPVAPGTMGSIGGLIVYLAVRNNPFLYAGAVIIIFMLGMASCGAAEDVFRRKDAGRIVIDEACGMMVSLAFLPFNIWIVIGAFLLFRFFDILKVPPMKSIESLSGSYGVMLDDIVAAVYTNIILQIIVFFSGS